jgi:hypothetical protein
VIVVLLRRYGPLVALVAVVVDLLVGLFVGERLVRWELEQIREAWTR